jgi:hypothetical protein
MLDNAKSLSTHASLAPGQLQAVPFEVKVTFTLDQGTPRWTFDPEQIKSGDLELAVSYCLSAHSAPGWSFTAITIEDSQPRPAWSFTYPNTSGTRQYTVQGEMEVTITRLEPASIVLLMDNLNHSAQEKTVSVKLVVSNAEGKSFTSPDPQIVLVPR